jgi:hypothetical protein
MSAVVASLQPDESRSGDLDGQSPLDCCATAAPSVPPFKPALELTDVNWERISFEALKDA